MLRKKIDLKKYMKIDKFNNTGFVKIMWSVIPEFMPLTPSFQLLF